jgi:hypothetical protein
VASAGQPKDNVALTRQNWQIGFLGEALPRRSARALYRYSAVDVDVGGEGAITVRARQDRPQREASAWKGDRFLRVRLGRVRRRGEDEQRKRDAESENDREPDPPHGHLRWGWLAGSLAKRRDAHQHAPRANNRARLSVKRAPFTRDC